MEKNKLNKTKAPQDRTSQRLGKTLEMTMGAKVKRRTFLKGLFAAGVFSAVSSCQNKSEKDSLFGKFFQKHYKELTPKDKQRVFDRIARETKSKRGIDINVLDPQPMDGVEFIYCLSLSKCNGSRFCVTACVKENNQSRDPHMSYIKVLEMDRGSLNLEKGNLYYEGSSIPKKDKFYLPAQCNQCDNPPCVKACPVEATWKEKDGIVVIDYDWCIGCRYCMAACPYEARRFNFKDPVLPNAQVNPNQGFLSNRIRPKGVVEKCHFCLHRTRNGQYPACLEACPTGARKFGNIKDPNSEVYKILKEKHVFVLKEELNTIPKFFYYFD